MIYTMRDFSCLACTLGVALTAACGDDGQKTETSSETDATTQPGPTDATTQPGTETDPTTVEPTTGSPTSEPTTTDGPTSDPTTDATDTTAATDPGTTTEDTDDTTTTGGPVCPYTPVDGMPEVALQLVANGFDRPVLTLSHPTQPERLFVVEQGGRIKILEPGMTTAPDDPDDFLYVKVKNENAGEIGPEQGLLGFAFHPDFPNDPRVYINYNPQDWQGAGPTYIDEYKLDANDPDKIDPASRPPMAAASTRSP